MSEEALTPADALDDTVRELREAGVAGVTIVFADSNGIPRSRTVPLAALPSAVLKGVGITTLFSVFDSHDVITYAHEGLANASGDVRLVPELHRLVPLAGQPGLAWAPGRQLQADGTPWSYDPRAVLEAQVERAAAAGLSVRAGYELEFWVGVAGEDFRGAHEGPAYSPHAMLAVDEFCVQLLRDLEANGLEIGQLHAEYGASQLELSLSATDPVSAADDQLLARQTIHAAARANGLRVSFAPLVTADGAGNGWHLHTSLWRGEENLLAGGPGDFSAEGGGYVAGLLAELPALAAVTAPSVPSLTRVRPGYFAGAFGFWGVENREAPLRFVPGSPLLGEDHANLELKTSDASANPYLALAVVIAAGLAGVEAGLVPPAPIPQDPGTWTAERREAAGVERLPQTPAEAAAALQASAVVTEALGPQVLGAFSAVRAADAAWADGKPTQEIVEAHRWRY